MKFKKITDTESTSSSIVKLTPTSAYKDLKNMATCKIKFTNKTIIISGKLYGIRFAGFSKENYVVYLSDFFETIDIYMKEHTDEALLANLLIEKKICIKCLFVDGSFREGEIL